MRVGSIVLATDQGLGYLAKSFYDHGIVDKVILIEHSSRYNHKDWYRPEDVCRSIEDLLSKVDSLIFFEELWNYWKIIPIARAARVKTALMVMYECTRHPLPYQPDVILAPSLLDKQFYPHAVHMPVPVEVKWQQRKQARVFVHNAGNGGIGGRNGTNELLKAMELVKSPVKLILRHQEPIRLDSNLGLLERARKDPRIEIRKGTVAPEDLWTEGDVFVFPERFNGLSLPLQEAYASGMLVMAGARFPMTEWLPAEPLIPVSAYSKTSIARSFERADYDPKQIAATIDAWYDADIAALSRRGRDWARENSWLKLKGSYETVLSPL